MPRAESPNSNLILICHPHICIMPLSAILSALRTRFALVMPPQRHFNCFASATQHAIARCCKTNAPIPSERVQYKCYILSLCMFPHINDFMLVHVAENVQHGHTFRWVAEFRGKKDTSMHKYSVLKIQWCFIKKI